MSAQRMIVVGVVVVLALMSLAVLAVPAAAARPVAGRDLQTVSHAASILPAKVPSDSVRAVSSASRAGLAQSIVQRIKAANVPMTAAYLPNLLAQVRVSNGVVQPLYTEAPAPMGIGDFGVRNTTGTPQGYFLQTTSWRGILTLNDVNALYLDDGAPDYFGAQLNTVMTNTTVQGNTTYRYWIQNVIQYSTKAHTLTFIDNIWNFSNPQASEPASTFYSGNGTPVDPVFYYDVGPTFVVPFPFTVYLYENSSLTVGTGPAPRPVWSTVRFGYDIRNAAGARLYSGIYDTVLFNSNVRENANPPIPKFTVDGFRPNPVGLLDDAELMIGGPGGGSTTTIFGIAGSERLQFWNTTSLKYENSKTAWNEGTDTGETVEGISEYYTAPGTVVVGPGPSIPMPFWNATPGGNIGQAVVQGTVAPSNSFFFFNQGTVFNQTRAAWAPVPPSGMYSWAMPPGNYYVETLASNYDPVATSLALAAGARTYDVAMTANRSRGIYAPLWAWNNAQLANISSAGTGTSADPYLLDNNQYGPLDSLFGEFNDYTFPVFSGIFLAGTNAFVNIIQAAPFNVEYPANYASALEHFGLPSSNWLPIQAYDASYISIWQGAFTGWFSSFLFFGPLVYTPIANVAFWNVTHSLIGNSTFTDLGSAILVAVGGSNVIWGNAIVPAAQEPSFYIYPDELGIQVLESGDLIYNNWVTVNVPAYALNYNLYTGAPQVNDNDWNLSAPEPAVNVAMVNGFALTGSIVGSDVQCGNFWGNYLPLAPLPYNNSGLIGNAGDGDYCPYPIGTYPHGVPFFTVTFTETGLTSGNWSVTVGGMTKTADPGSAISFLLSNGIWPFSVASSDGLTPNPASGTLTLPGAGDVTVSFVAPLAAAEGGLPSPTDVNQPVSFTATPSGGSGTYTYAWGFGDGASSTDQNPTHTYTTNGTYNVTLSVNDSFGGSFSTWMNVTVNPLPEWTVSASVSSTDVGRPVDFRSTYANGTEPYTFSWDFGDGSVSSAQNPGHAYASPALYFVLFEITDAAGVSSSRVIPVLVNPVPQVTASASTTAPVTGQSVDFTGLVGGGTNPFNFTWTFGDGSTASAQNTSHAFGSAGTYKVTFRVIDRVGMPAATTFTLVVSESSVTTTTAVVGSAAALIIGIVATALVLTYLTRRRKKPNEPGPGSQGGSSSPPSP